MNRDINQEHSMMFQVKLAKHTITGQEVAIKIIDKTALNPSSLQKVSYC